MKNEITEKIFASRPFSDGMYSFLQIFQVINCSYKTWPIISINTYKERSRDIAHFTG